MILKKSIMETRPPKFMILKVSLALKLNKHAS